MREAASADTAPGSELLALSAGTTRFRPARPKGCFQSGGRPGLSSSPASATEFCVPSFPLTLSSLTCKLNKSLMCPHSVLPNVIACSLCYLSNKAWGGFKYRWPHFIRKTLRERFDDFLKMTQKIETRTLCCGSRNRSPWYISVSPVPTAGL